MIKAHWIFWLNALFLCLHAEEKRLSIPKFFEEPHLYWEQERKDPFSIMIPDLVSGNIQLTKTSEKAFLKDLLSALKIPEESQLLVYSSTSLQLSKINLNNPRAIYFNESISIGYIPGAKIEVISIDPEYGAFFYIFPIPNEHQSLKITPTKRCMNCHAGEDNHRTPGFLIESVIVGPQGGSLNSFRSGMPSHELDYEKRFGGWAVTGPQYFKHLGNHTGKYLNGKIETMTFKPETTLPLHKFIKPDSELLTHLIFDHQAGFVNRCIQSVYLWRASQTRAELLPVFEKSIQSLVNYTLFKNEKQLPSPIKTDQSPFASVFLKDKNPLKAFNLHERLFKYTCSYMILSDYFMSLPEEVRGRVTTEIMVSLESSNSKEDLELLNILKSHF